MPPAPVYYRPREQLGPRVALAIPVGVALGVAYAVACCLVTQVFEAPPLFVLVTPLFGGALAAASRWVADRAQVRSRSARLALAVATSAIALYVSWQAYLVLFDVPGLAVTPTWTMSPARLVHALAELANRNGHGSWIWWLAEAAIVVSMVVYLMREVDIEVPFCERCHAWTKVVVTLPRGCFTAFVTRWLTLSECGFCRRSSAHFLAPSWALPVAGLISSVSG